MKSVLLISFTIFLGTALLLYIFQRSLIYFPQTHQPTLKAYHAEDMQVVSIKTKDHLDLYAWYKPAQPNHPTLLYLHGNAGHIGYRMSTIRSFLNQGYGVLLLEYRGYGGNPGRPTEQGLYQDARGALAFLHQQHISNANIILYGESLGTAVAVQMALETKVAALILQSPLTSLHDVQKVHYPWISFIQPWDKYDSIHKINTIEMPLLIIHGTDDDVVPYYEGQQLFERANSPKQMISLPGKHHNDLFEDQTLFNKIKAFIEQ